MLFMVLVPAGQAQALVVDSGSASAGWQPTGSGYRPSVYAMARVGNMVVLGGGSTP